MAEDEVCNEQGRQRALEDRVLPDLSREQLESDALSSANFSP